MATWMRVPLGVFLLIGLSAPALGQEQALPAVVVLEDGQTIEGRVRVEADGAVVVLLEQEGQAPQEVRLAAEAVTRIDPIDRDEEALPLAEVNLADGRSLRGQVRVRPSEVVIKGPFGEVVVAREEVETIKPVLPDAPRVALDADLGLSFRIPTGWSPDDTGGIGERLRLVHHSTQAWLTVLVRQAPGAQPNAERVRAALAADLSESARITREGSRFRIVDELQDPATDRPLERLGFTEFVGELAVVVLGSLDMGSDEEVGELRSELHELVGAYRWLREGRVRDGHLFRHEGARLLLEAPAGFRIAKAKDEDALVRIVSPTQPDSVLRLWIADEAEVESALLDRFQREPQEPTRATFSGVELLRAEGEGERGVAYRLGEQTVVLVARSTDPGTLSRLTAGVVIVDPGSVEAEARAASEAAAVRAQAQDLLESDPRGALTLLDPVLEAHPEDPQCLALEVAAFRKEGRPEELLQALDALWVASGSVWLAEELSRVLVRQAETAAEREDGYEEAADAYERAAGLFQDEVVLGQALDFFLEGARQAFEGERDRTKAWARLARARRVVGNYLEIDDLEVELRLAAAQHYLTDEESPEGARREAHRAYLLGADPDKINSVYDRAEKLQIRLAKAAGKQTKRGFAFGVPPTRNTRRSRRIRPTAFVRNTRRNKRYARTFRNRRNRRFVRNQRRGRRVRARPRRRSKRVRTNGGFVFG